jgi:hypothetical protein
LECDHRSPGRILFTLEISNDSSKVVTVRGGMCATSFANLFHNFILPHFCYSSSSSSGVRMTGKSNPTAHNHPMAKLRREPLFTSSAYELHFAPTPRRFVTDDARN